MATIVIVFVAGSVLGLLVGIVIGWSAAPVSIWAERVPEPASTPRYVGMNGGETWATPARARIGADDYSLRRGPD